jgi:hypothetical protein
MNPILLAGIGIVNLALVFYTLFFIWLLRKKTVGSIFFVFLILGLTCDIISTGCMILGSSNGPITFHGVIGYIALLGMAADAILIARFRKHHKVEKTLPTTISRVSMAFYMYWVVVYIAGILLVALKS